MSLVYVSHSVSRPAVLSSPLPHAVAATTSSTATVRRMLLGRSDGRGEFPSRGMSASRRVSSAKPVLATAAQIARTERTPPPRRAAQNAVAPSGRYGASRGDIGRTRDDLERLQHEAV